jgi:hypothetical protein
MPRGGELVDALKGLAVVVAGPVLLPGDPGYQAELAGYNAAVRQAPLAVVGVTSVADVSEAVRFAASHGLPIAVQSTGHAPMRPAEAALLISTRRLGGVEIDPEAWTARVGAGVRWSSVVEAAAPYGLAPLNGATPSVGVIGYLTGGGIGPLARSYGYAADHVRSLEIVTPDGMARTANPQDNADLFWAVRGGKGNFGVVTSVVIDLFPVRTLFGGGIYFPGEAAPAVLTAYREWVRTVPEAMTSSVALLRLAPDPNLPPPLQGEFVVHLRIAFNGSAVDGERLVAPLRQVAPIVIDTVGEMPYSAVGTIHNDPPGPIPFYDTSTQLADLTADAVDAVLRLAGPGVDTSITLVEIRHLGGALVREPQQPNAVGGRDAGFLVYACSIVPPEEAAQAVAAHRALLSALAPWKAGQALLNFTTSGSPELVAAAFGAQTHARLLELKAKYDPANLFRFAGLTR